MAPAMAMRETWRWCRPRVRSDSSAGVRKSAEEEEKGVSCSCSSSTPVDDDGGKMLVVVVVVWWCGSVLPMLLAWRRTACREVLLSLWSLILS